ncbi:MAG: hypothetical protein IPF87_15270 [Gemmatimonadetes bacterium]|nr:hypothetical protein [Gemmatimonadota bacterium]HNV76946.1 hypothetical protein [Gemmatimonadaceae bacterium]MBK6842624.1 hypothetical protein [Gemmatimonadota bacterium]MBK7831738.1 hypothetical protein [Gemmatimonadota bacterium]MBK8059244.1 hypothetical protein [Gemmatimonadota bacterium]
MSRPLMLGIILVIVAESVAVHALVYSRWPMASVALLVLNIATIWWIYREGTAGSCTTVRESVIEVRHGRSMRLDVPLASVRDARVPAWQDIPGAGTSGYLALSGGDDPNALLTLDPPASARLAMGIRRRVSTLGMRLESPGAFVAAVNEVVERAHARR